MNDTSLYPGTLVTLDEKPVIRITHFLVSHAFQPGAAAAAPGRTTPAVASMAVHLWQRALRDPVTNQLQWIRVQRRLTEWHERLLRR